MIGCAIFAAAFSTLIISIKSFIGFWSVRIGIYVMMPCLEFISPLLAKKDIWILPLLFLMIIIMVINVNHIFLLADTVSRCVNWITIPSLPMMFHKTQHPWYFFWMKYLTVENTVIQHTLTSSKQWCYIKYGIVTKKNAMTTSVDDNPSVPSFWKNAW